MTSPDGHDAEPAIVYDAGERRTHAEHAAEAYDFAQRADALQALAERAMEDALEFRGERHEVASLRCAERAQWHATMAVYHAIVDQGWR
jgi:predicted RNA-binding protein Jag